MKQALPVVDNITDILNVVMQFTSKRRKVLAQNLQETANANYQAKDLPAAAFSLVLEEALDELSNNQRVLWRDLDFMSLAANGRMQFSAMSDPKANHLKETDSEAYVQYQTQLLLENEINQKMVTNLLARHKASPAVVTA